MKNILFAIVVATCGTTFALQRRPYTVSVNVDLVLLNVHVLDRRDRPVRGLDASNFRVYQDHRLQEVAFFSGYDAPATVGLIVDTSGSMAPKWPDVRMAVALFAENSNAQDQMFILKFNNRLHWSSLGGKAFTNDVSELETAMNGAVPSGKTALYDAVSAALDYTRRGKFEKKSLVILSDGRDNASSESLRPLLTALRQANVTIYTVGLFKPMDWNRNPEALQGLADVTGGKAYFPETHKELQEALRDIAGQIRNQYTLGYYPGVPPDGRYHKLSVKVESSSGKSLSAETRPGYFARTDKTGN